MRSYEETMRLGAAAYTDATNALRHAGVPARFTQTGGMNAALEAYLDGGAYLLVTDADDALSWDRAEQLGWGAGLHTNDEDQDLIAYATTDDTNVTALVDLVRGLLRDAVAAPRAG